MDGAAQRNLSLVLSLFHLYVAVMLPPSPYPSLNSPANLSVRECAVLIADFCH